MAQLEEIERDGNIHPCNGYFLIEAQDDHESGLIVVRDPTTQEFRSGVIVEMSGDHTHEEDIPIESWEWQRGDLIYFSGVTEVDGSLFVHWTDIVAFRRF